MDPETIILAVAFVGLLYAIVNPASMQSAFQTLETAAGGAMSTVSGSVIDAIANAIATAEGWYNSGPDSIPHRANNPGDLVATWLPYPRIGAEGITVFPTEAEGWAALKHQVALMFSGSANYNPGMSIAEVAAKYTRTQIPVWANNVAAALGVTPDTKLQDIAARYV